MWKCLSRLNIQRILFKLVRKYDQKIPFQKEYHSNKCMYLNGNASSLNLHRHQFDISLPRLLNPSFIPVVYIWLQNCRKSWLSDTRTLLSGTFDVKEVFQAPIRNHWALAYFMRDGNQFFNRWRPLRGHPRCTRLKLLPKMHPMSYLQYLNSHIWIQLFQYINQVSQNWCRSNLAHVKFINVQKFRILSKDSLWKWTSKACFRRNFPTWNFNKKWSNDKV